MAASSTCTKTLLSTIRSTPLAPRNITHHMGRATPRETPLHHIRTRAWMSTTTYTTTRIISERCITRPRITDRLVSRRSLMRLHNQVWHGFRRITFTTCHARDSRQRLFLRRRLHLPSHLRELWQRSRHVLQQLSLHPHRSAQQRTPHVLDQKESGFSWPPINLSQPRANRVLVFM